MYETLSNFIGTLPQNYQFIIPVLFLILILFLILFLLKLLGVDL